MKDKRCISCGGPFADVRTLSGDVLCLSCGVAAASQLRSVHTDRSASSAVRKRPNREILRSPDWRRAEQRAALSDDYLSGFIHGWLIGALFVGVVVSVWAWW